MESITLGCLEKVSMPDLKVDTVWAKIDTGAYSGALHCSDIKLVRRGADKIRILKFTPLGDTANAQETKEFLETYTRSSTGHRVKRYVIDTEIVLGGATYPIKIGLADRTKMMRPVLIGRRFLRENNIVVDVSINAEYDSEGDNTK